MPSSPSTLIGIPQSKSLVTALGFKPLSSQDLTCPVTLGFQSSLCSFVIQSVIKSSNSFKFIYQCLVSLRIGLEFEIVDFGFLSSSVLNVLPQFSHWSP